MPILPNLSRASVARTTLTGQLAGLVSTVALLGLGARHGRVLAPVDAISHWVWPWRVRWQPGDRLGPVLTGLAIHQAASTGWAFVHARWRRRPDAGDDEGTILRDALAIAGLAALVDLRLTPARFTPGFEQHLDRFDLALVYASFGLALACRDAGFPDRRIRSVQRRAGASADRPLRSDGRPAVARAERRSERDGG